MMPEVSASVSPDTVEEEGDFMTDGVSKQHRESGKSFFFNNLTSLDMSRVTEASTLLCTFNLQNFPNDVLL